MPFLAGLGHDMAETGQKRIMRGRAGPKPPAQNLSNSLLDWLVEHLDAIVNEINDVDVVLAVYSQVCWTVELPIPIAGAAPGSQVLPIRVELADPILLEV